MFLDYKPFNIVKFRSLQKVCFWGRDSTSRSEDGYAAGGLWCLDMDHLSLRGSVARVGAYRTILLHVKNQN